MEKIIIIIYKALYQKTTDISSREQIIVSIITIAFICSIITLFLMDI